MKIVAFLIGISISWYEVAQATPPGFEPAPLRRAIISVMVDDGGNRPITIEIRMNKENNLSTVCIEEICNDVILNFPVVKYIHDIPMNNVSVLRGAMIDNKGWIRIVLPFNKIDIHDSRECKDMPDVSGNEAIALTFDRSRKIQSIAIICDIGGLYYERNE